MAAIPPAAGPAHAGADGKAPLDTSQLDSESGTQNLSGKRDSGEPTCPATAEKRPEEQAAEAQKPNPDPQPAPEPEAEAEADAEPALPPLTPQEFRKYNRLAEHMDYFHNHFRQTWTLLYGACTSGRRPANMSLKQFIDEGLQFVQHLTAHHNIEETYVFPLLARKMPEFQPAGRGGNRKAAELLQQHRQIHAGMDAFEEYLRRCRGREVELELAVLKTKMDPWNEVLWKHLEQEVRTLGAENMRRYWTLEEMRSLPM